MSLENEVADLKEKVQAMTDCASATKEAYTQVAELKDKIVALETELQNTKGAYDALVSTTEAAKKMSEEEMMKREEEMKKAKSELEIALEAVAAYKNKEEEMMKKEKKMKRMASLIEKGIDQEVVASTVDQFESLEDSTFDALVALFTEAAKKKAEMPMKEEKKASSSNETNTEEALDNVETNTEDLDLSAGSDHTENVDTTRAALVDFVCARLGKKLNKGE
jgi:hypothetical protein